MKGKGKKYFNVRIVLINQVCREPWRREMA